MQTVFGPAGAGRLLTRILVPLDFSTASFRDLRSAVALARATLATIHVIHVATMHGRTHREAGNRHAF